MKGKRMVTRTLSWTSTSGRRTTAAAGWKMRTDMAPPTAAGLRRPARPPLRFSPGRCCRRSRSRRWNSSSRSSRARRRGTRRGPVRILPGRRLVAPGLRRGPRRRRRLWRRGRSSSSRSGTGRLRRGMAGSATAAAASRLRRRRAARRASGAEDGEGYVSALWGQRTRDRAHVASVLAYFPLRPVFRKRLHTSVRRQRPTGDGSVYG